MAIHQISLVRDFTDLPSGRERGEAGASSGEAFREDLLRPALLKHDVVEINLDGADCLPPGWLDEAIGKQAAAMGAVEFERRVKIVLTDDKVALRKLQESIALRTVVPAE